LATVFASFAVNEVLIVCPVTTAERARGRRCCVCLIWSLGSRQEFRLRQYFPAGIYANQGAFRPDIIHLHHPNMGRFAGFVLLQTPGRTCGLHLFTRAVKHYAHFCPCYPGIFFRNLISHSTLSFNALPQKVQRNCGSRTLLCKKSYLRMIGVKTPTYGKANRGIDFQRARTLTGRPPAAERI